MPSLSSSKFAPDVPPAQYVEEAVQAHHHLEVLQVFGTRQDQPCIDSTTLLLCLSVLMRAHQFELEIRSVQHKVPGLNHRWQKIWVGLENLLALVAVKGCNDTCYELVLRIVLRRETQLGKCR